MSTDDGYRPNISITGCGALRGYTKKVTTCI
jgi:hypothetical protein